MYSKQIKLKSRSVPFRKQIPASPWLSGVSHPGRVCNYMRYLTLAFLLMAGSVAAQTKGDDQIQVKGVSFHQVVSGLLDAGYQVQSLDSNYQTVTTEFRNVPLKSGRKSTVFASFYIRVKDSTAFITGKWYSDLFSGRNPSNAEKNDVKLTSGASKFIFESMDKFAQGLDGEIKYGEQ